MVDGTEEGPIVRAVVVDHVDLKVLNLEGSRRFYETALASLGFGVVYSAENRVSFGVEGADDFAIVESGTPSTGVHVAFAAPNRAAVDAFHSAALKAGGRDNGAPGLRPEYHAGYYGAFVIDPCGNNVEAVHHDRTAKG